MPLNDLIRSVQELNLPEGSKVADLCERMLLAVLDAEGPPAYPVIGFSSEEREAIARSPKGRALYLCHTWQTGDWTCLLLDLPPIAMGRPLFLPNPAGKGPPRTVLDYKSAKFQNRVVAACKALRLPTPPAPCRVCLKLDAGRIFVAWAPIPPELTRELPGDLDNYAKNLLDGLQRHGQIANDKQVADLHTTREPLPAITRTLHDALRDHVLSVRSANPELTTQRALAKAAGISQRLTRELLRAVK